METLGDLLRETRVKKGLSYEDIQEMTKIRVRYLMAIEDNELSKLPGPFYSKAFIKTYAEALELEPEQIKEFEHYLPDTNLKEVNVKANFNDLANPPSKWTRWLTLSLVFILIFLVLLFAYMFVVNSSNNEDLMPSDHIEDTRLETTEEPKEPSKGDEVAVDEPEGNDNVANNNKNQKPDINISKISTSTYKHRPLDTYEVSIPNGEEATIQLKFNDLCWFDIREKGPTGKQLLTNSLNAGEETQPIPLDDKVSIHLGNASAADIYINGNKIKAGIEKGIPKYIIITKKTKN